MSIMMPVEWTSDDLVFSRQLDADHRKLFGELEKVRQAIADHTPANQVRYRIWRLSKDASIHVASEERLMRQNRYPAAHWHANQHLAGRNKMARLAEAVQKGNADEQASAFDELAQWIKDHVRLADRMLAAHLRNEQRERLAS